MHSKKYDNGALWTACSDCDRGGKCYVCGQTHPRTTAHFYPNPRPPPTA